MFRSLPVQPMSVGALDRQELPDRMLVHAFSNTIERVCAMANDATLQRRSLGPQFPYGPCSPVDASNAAPSQAKTRRSRAPVAPCSNHRAKDAREQCACLAEIGLHARAFKRVETWSRPITNKTARGARRTAGAASLAEYPHDMNIQGRIEAFLRGSTAALAVVGQTGSGKTHAVEVAAKAAGFQATVLDRTQGSISYNRLGVCALGQDGLTRTVTIVCGADSETALPDPKRLPLGTKLIFIGNNCSAELKKAGIHIEKLNRPTQEAMCKTLFLDHDWPVAKAKRLSALADGDWRRVWSLDRLFAGAGVDVAECNDDDFRALMLHTAKDKNLLETTPPSAAVHQLFSGYAASSNTVSDYAEHSVMMWTEANQDIVCNSIEKMAEFQEAAVYADVLATGGQHEIGLETFSMCAAQNANPNLRYDFTKYRNPWAAARKETPEAKYIRESWQRRGSWTKRRLAAAQDPDDAQDPANGAQDSAKPGRKRCAPAGTQSAPKRKTAPKM